MGMKTLLDFVLDFLRIIFTESLTGPLVIYADRDLRIVAKPG
jgi:hypothetical protein